jgi:hypothetical protein
MKQQYTPLGKPNWWFGVSLYGRPQLARDIGMCRNFAEAKARFEDAPGREEVGTRSICAMSLC